MKILYIITNIFNLQQLEKLQRNTIDSIKSAIHRIIEIHKSLIMTEYGELILLDTGNENSADPQHIIDIAFYIKELLDAEQEYLFGYNIMLLASEETNHSNLIAKYKPQFLALEADEVIWIDKSLTAFFQDYCDFQPCGEYSLVTGKKIPHKNTIVSNDDKYIHLSTRENLFNAFNTIIDTKSTYQVIHFHGATGTGKSLIMEEIINSLYPESFRGYVPRNYLRFKKSSHIHPLLNSISIPFLKRVPEFLNSIESTIWEEISVILFYLKANAGNEKCPDRILEDFYIGYNLYITAYIRLMESNLLPALFICDDLDRYHKKTYKFLRTLINDFINLTAFIPVFINKHSNLPDRLGTFKTGVVKASPINIKEIDKITRKEFPALTLDKKAYRELKLHAHNQLIPIIRNLIYLNMQRQSDNPLSLPETKEDTLWYIIENLDVTAKDILYCIHISGGLLPFSELTQFLIAYGLKEDSIYKYIRQLTNNLLIYADEYLVPYYPFYRQKLEKLLDKRSEYLKNLISDYIIKLWKNRSLLNYVLLFSFFMNYNFTEYAFEILPLLIKRKLDESDFPGVRPFLLFENFNFPGGIDAQQSQTLHIILASGKIRLCLLERKIEEAEQIAANILKADYKFLQDTFHSELSLNISRLYLARKDVVKAVQNTKNCLIIIQELENRTLIGQAYKILGFIMLVSGRIGDAIDYFTLAEKFLDEASAPYERIQSIFYHAIATFIKGNLSKALSLINKGIRLSNGCAKRNFEILFTFFQARIYFEYGDYDKALTGFQKNLTLCYIYANKSALAVNYTWISRVELYKGNIKDAINLLDHFALSRENLFVKSEALYFQGLWVEARETIEQALVFPETHSIIFDENISWANGYEMIEEKCLSINKSNSIFRRVLKAFGAYLQGINGDIITGIQTLQMMIRTEKFINQDPNSHFYYFLYALLLYRNTEQVFDDSLTILNQAMKLLQERASKIDDPLERTFYLNQNYWNMKILDEAKKRKLL